MNFSHNYFSVDPTTKKQIVLCMKCEKTIKSPSLTKEVPVQWIYRNGMKGEGVVITCPDCINFELTDEVKVNIKAQLIQAFELEMSESGYSKEQTQEFMKLFSEMNLVGRN